MASGQPPRRRNPNRPGEPVTGAPADGVTVSEPKTSASGSQPSTDSAGTQAAADLAAANLAAADADRDSRTSEPSRLSPETDAAVAAASAAAAAAVAAVSAAIAATAATKATRISRAAAAKADADQAAAAAVVAPIPVTAPIPTETPAPAAPLAATTPLATPTATPLPLATPLPTPTPLPLHRLANGPVPVSVDHYVRAPGRDVSGLTRAHHDEDDAPSAAAMFASAASISAPIGSHVTTNGYSRPPVPDVPGIIRAPIVEGEEDATSNEIPPLFSNEGIFRQSVAAKPGWKARIVGPVAGVAAALLAAGSALGYKARGGMSSVKSTVGTVPDRVRGTAATGRVAGFRARAGGFGTSIVGGLRNFKETRVFGWIASAALAVRTGAVWIGSALAVVFVPIFFGLSRFVTVPANAASRWLQGGGESSSPDFDEYGNPRRKRRIAPFWIAFAGFYVVLALIVAAAWFGSSVATTTANPSASRAATATKDLAAGSVGVKVSPTTTHMPVTTRPTATPTARPTDKPTPKPTPVPAKSPTASATTASNPTPTLAPTHAPTLPPTAKPTARPTAKPTARPTAPPTAKPTATPTPVTPPPPVSVSYEKDGTTVTVNTQYGPRTYKATPTGTQTTPFILFIDVTPGASCSIASTPSHPAPSMDTASGATPTYVIRWGRDGVRPNWTYWPAGNYTITTTCTLAGYSSGSAIKQVTVTP